MEQLIVPSVPRAFIVPDKQPPHFLFQKSSEAAPGTSRSPNRFLPVQQRLEKHIMKKVSYILAALATIAVAAPTIASAQGFDFRLGGDRNYYRDDYRGPRADLAPNKVMRP